jgi:hypothetical protein
MSFRRQTGGLNKPKWQIYDVHNNPEWELAENYVTEYCDIVGIECIYYMYDDNIKPDDIYGEWNNKEFIQGKKTSLIMDIVETPTNYALFGMVANDQLTVHIPQATYRRDISRRRPPRVGDVIVLPFYRNVPNSLDEDSLVGRTFDINHVATDLGIFQYNALTYTFYISPYIFSEQSESAREISSEGDDISVIDYGDNDNVQNESELIYDYVDVDRRIYGK